VLGLGSQLQGLCRYGTAMGREFHPWDYSPRNQTPTTSLLKLIVLPLGKFKRKKFFFNTKIDELFSTIFVKKGGGGRRLRSIYRLQKVDCAIFKINTSRNSKNMIYN
jgi:hypothetical protein